MIQRYTFYAEGPYEDSRGDWVLWEDLQWQPIETVPKDGSAVDLCGLNYMGEWERWPAAHWVKDPLDQSELDHWEGPWSDGCNAPLDERDRPTHWMPVPPFPDSR